MNLNWRQRLELQPELRDINHWPYVDPATLSSTSRKKFHRNLEIITRVQKGDPINQIAHYFNIPASTITRLLNRCLDGPADEIPNLSRGLIPRIRLKNSQRKKALGTLDLPAGSAHAFKHLLASVPGLKIYLEEIIKRAVKRSRRGQNIRPKAFHAAFIRYLKGINWPQDTYPFSVPSRGYETLRTYLKQRIIALNLPKQATRIILTKVVTRRFYKEIQIDEYTVDCHGHVTIEFNRDFIPQRLARIHLLTARDVATGCVLGYVFSLSPAPTAEDVLALLGQLVSSWQPMKLTTPGLQYPPGGCLPTALGQSYPRLIIGVIRMDNALAHLALSVRHYVCNVLGATLNLGLIKYPQGRHVIEQAFAKLNIDLHRLPSTTGSHPHAEIREPTRHQKKAPVISLRAIEEMISVLYVEHNIRPQGSLSGASPLAMAQYQMTKHPLPMRPRFSDDTLNPLATKEKAYIRQNKDHQPHIHYAGTRYKGRGICEADLINQQVSICINREDLRQLQVTTLDGKSLGTVMAPNTWQRFKHGVTTRKYINRLIREDLITREDPLGGYFDYMLEHCSLPSKALEMVRLSREFSQTEIIKPDEDHDSQPQYQIASDTVQKKILKKIPSWHPGMVTDRRSEIDNGK